MEPVTVLDHIWYISVLKAKCPHDADSSQNVHEGPIGIGTRIQYSEVPLSPGNVISDGKRSFGMLLLFSILSLTEPGYYEDGNFGIRIESKSQITSRMINP